MSAKRNWFLTSGTYFCEHEGDVIFLCLSRNRYFGAQGRAVSALHQLVSGWKTVDSGSSGNESDADEALLEDLAGCGLLTNTASAGKIAEQVCLDSSNQEIELRRDLISSRPSPVETWHFIIALVTVIARLKFRGIESVLNRWHKHASSEPSPGSCASEREVVRLVNAYCRIRSWFFTAREACLIDSMVMREFLHIGGIEADFVMGVAFRPFKAHAWLQHHAIVLNDSPEHVSTYQPIFVFSA